MVHHGDLRGRGMQVSSTLAALDLMATPPDGKRTYRGLTTFCQPARERWLKDAVERQKRKSRKSWLQTCVYACASVIARGSNWGDVVLEVCPAPCADCPVLPDACKHMLSWGDTCPGARGSLAGHSNRAVGSVKEEISGILCLQPLLQLLISSAYTLHSSLVFFTEIGCMSNRSQVRTHTCDFGLGYPADKMPNFCTFHISNCGRH
jgi:hypothetical protein